MADWPKEIVIRGISITVNSWEEFDEVVERYGTTEAVPLRPATSGTSSQARHGTVQLTPTDRTMLRQFVANGRRGLLNRELSGPLGATGNAIPGALEAWGRRVGLTDSEGGTAFESFNMGRAGRGYRLTEIAAAVARSLLGMEEGAT
jgi:hypothetical protein